MVESQMDRVEIWGSLFTSECKAVAFTWKLPLGRNGLCSALPCMERGHGLGRRSRSGHRGPELPQVSVCEYVCVRMTPELLCARVHTHTHPSN